MIKKNASEGEREEFAITNIRYKLNCVPVSLYSNTFF